MKFSGQRDTLLTPLLQVVGAIERRQTTPVLGNVLIKADSGVITFTASDTEIELHARASMPDMEPGEVTVPARKFVEIVRNLPESAPVSFESMDQQAVLKSGRSRFKLATLPAEDFPMFQSLVESQSVSIAAEQLLQCIRSTAFSMAHQDVRFYLNGMLLEIDDQRLACITTDGHRLAYSQCATSVQPATPVRMIIPRKSVGELQRLLGTLDADVQVRLEMTAQLMQVHAADIRLTTKLIDGRFPDYNRVIPVDGNKELIIDGPTLRQSLARASILSNEKYRGVRMALSSGLLTISSNNPDQEEAVDELEVDYEGDPAEIGFNVTYLLEVLSTLDSVNARIRLKDGGSSVLITPESSAETRYVVMPMRL